VSCNSTDLLLSSCTYSGFYEYNCQVVAAVICEPGSTSSSLIIGVAVGVGGGVIVILVILICCIRRHRNRKRRQYYLPPVERGIPSLSPFLSLATPKTFFLSLSPAFDLVVPPPQYTSQMYAPSYSAHAASTPPRVVSPPPFIPTQPTMPSLPAPNLPPPYPPNQWKTLQQERELKFAVMRAANAPAGDQGNTFFRDQQILRDAALAKQLEEEMRTQEARRKDVAASSQKFEQAKQDNKYDSRVALPNTQLSETAHLSNFRDDMTSLSKKTDQNNEFFQNQQRERDAALARQREEEKRVQLARTSDVASSSQKFEQAKQDTRYDRSVTLPGAQDTAHLANFRDDMDVLSKRTKAENEFFKKQQGDREASLARHREEEKKAQEARKNELASSSQRFEQASKDQGFDKNVVLPSQNLPETAHLANFRSDMDALSKRSQLESDYFKKQQMERDAKLVEIRDGQVRKSEERNSQLISSSAKFGDAKADIDKQLKMKDPQVTTEKPAKDKGKGKGKDKEKEKGKQEDVGPAVGSSSKARGPDLGALLETVRKEMSERSKEQLVVGFVREYPGNFAPEDALLLVTTVFSPFSRMSIVRALKDKVANREE